MEENLDFESEQSNNWNTSSEFHTSNYSVIDDTFVWNDVKLIIREYVPPIQLLLCVFGSILSCVVIWDMMKQVTPLCLYLFFLGPLDIACLFLASSNKWLALISNASFLHDVISKSDTMCKVYHFLSHFLAHFNSWVVVCLISETLLLVRRPEKARCVTLRRAIDVIVLLTALLASLNAHYFWTFGLVKVDTHPSGTLVREKQCIFSAKSLQGYQDEPWYGEILIMIHWVVADAIPMTIIVICLVWNYTASRKSLAIRRHFREGTDSLDLLPSDATCPKRAQLQSSTGSKYHEMTASGPLNELRDKTFVYIPALFLLFNLPYFVCRPLERYASSKASKESYAQLALASVILWEWKMMFYTCKVLVYLATSRWFRRKMAFKLTALCRKIRKGRTAY